MFTFRIGTKKTLGEDAVRVWINALQDYYQQQLDTSTIRVKQQLRDHSPRNATKKLLAM